MEFPLAARSDHAMRPSGTDGRIMSGVPLPYWKCPQYLMSLLCLRRSMDSTIAPHSAIRCIPIQLPTVEDVSILRHFGVFGWSRLGYCCSPRQFSSEMAGRIPRRWKWDNDKMDNDFCSHPSHAAGHHQTRDMRRGISQASHIERRLASWPMACKSCPRLATPRQARKADGFLPYYCCRDDGRSTHPSCHGVLSWL